MSLTSLAALAVSASDSKEPGCEPLPSARSSPTQEPSSPSIGLASPATTMCAVLPLTALEQMELFPMSSVAGFPAKTSPSPAKASACQATEAASGTISAVWLARYAPPTSSWKTSQHSASADLDEFSETWPRSGMMRSGTAFRLPPLVRLTKGTGSGSLPTPTATDFKSESMSFALVERRQAASKRGVRLSEYLQRKFLPTPNAGNSHWGGRLDEWGGSTNPFRGTEIGCLRLNPCWVEELMGFPVDWTALNVSEIPSSRKSRKSSVKP